MMTFNYSGIPVEVTDEKQVAKLADIVELESYTQAALDKAAPGLMAALQQEFKTCQDVGQRPAKFVVKGGLVLAEMKPDLRRVKFGVNIGNR